MNFAIDEMRETDWQAVLRIYVEGLGTGNATFETSTPTWESWDLSHLKHSRLVARDGVNIVGWAALSPISERCIYGRVADISIYVGEAGRGRGVGTALINALIKSSEECKIWTLQAGIFPENTASVNLHLRNGFREVGRRERIGKHNGVWRDTILLERRSSNIGVD